MVAGAEKADKFPQIRSPKQVGGGNTQNLFVYVDDVDAHCERARAKGARDRRRAEGLGLRRGLLVGQELRVRGRRRPPLVVLRAPAQPEAEGMTDLDRTLAALSDPARRGAVDLLRVKPRRAGELAASLGLSAPAMSRHLRVLQDDRPRRGGARRGGWRRARPRLPAAGPSRSTRCARGSSRSRASGRSSSPRSSGTPSAPGRRRKKKR